jgi:hypothetical protein
MLKESQPFSCGHRKEMEKRCPIAGLFRRNDGRQTEIQAEHGREDLLSHVFG